MGSAQHTILFVDDEQNILYSLERLFKREGYNVLTATSGEQGLGHIKDAEVSVVVADYKMPDMNGVEFLSKVKEVSPDTVRIMLTGYADMGGTVDAINQGGVSRFITKPWDNDGIKLVVREGVEGYYLVMENRRLFALVKEHNVELENKVREKTAEIRENFFSFVRIVSDLMELYDPYAGGHSKRVAEMAKGLAVHMALEEAEVDTIEAAGLLHNIGLIGIPKSTIDKEDVRRSDHERALLRYNPILTQELLSSIDTLKQAAFIIRSHMERFDGTGYPDGLKGDEIPLGSRIVSICNFQDRLRHDKKGGSPPDLIEDLIRREAGKRFDPQLVSAFLTFLSRRKEEKTGEKIPLSDIEAGMILTKNLMTCGGKLLLPRDTILTDVLIKKVRSFAQVDPLTDDVHIMPDRRV